MKEITPEQLKEMKTGKGLAFQTSIYTWFLNRQKRGKLMIEVQDPKKTNAILLKNEIENLALYTPEELASLLEVDAVITGHFETDKPMSDGASIALNLVIGFWGTTNAATVNMSVNNGTGGQLIELQQKSSRRFGKQYRYAYQHVNAKSFPQTCLYSIK